MELTMDQAMPNTIASPADQLRADFLGCDGGKPFTTPNIYQLVQPGLRNDQALSPSQLCSGCVDGLKGNGS